MLDSYRGLAQNKTIELLRFPLIVCIVFLHSYSGAPDWAALNWSALSLLDCYELFRVMVCKVFVQLAVPCFFLISGYLFFRNVRAWDRKVYASKLKRRVHSLLIPYLLWNLLAIVANCTSQFAKYLLGVGSLSDVFSWIETCGGFFMLFWDCSAFNANVSVAELQSTPVDGPMWYVRDLMVLAVLSPIICWLVKRLGVWLVVLLGLFYVGGLSLGVTGLGTTSVFFFTFGAYLAFGKGLTSLWVVRVPAWLLVIALLPVCTYFYVSGNEVGNVLLSVFCVVAVVAVVCVGLQCQRKDCSAPGLLTRSVFFVYAAHTINIFGAIGELPGLLYGGDQATVKLLLFVLVPVLKIAACVAVYAVLAKFFPQLLRLLTGSRC